VLIFDEFESTGKTSIDFLIDFTARMPNHVHLILSFNKEREYQRDQNSTNLYEYLKENLIDSGKAVEIALGGLSAQDLGKWITYARNITLPLVPDLLRIRERSAGIPLVFE
jgi:hypothetical protein